MAIPVHAPRVNNNDDAVKVVRIAVAPGDVVAAGDLLMEVETEKATIDVEAESGGHVLAILCETGQSLAVGSVAMWLGATADEPLPQDGPRAEAGAGAGGDGGGMTAKARLLLRRHGLEAEAIPHAGPRLLATDVEAWLAANPRRGVAAPARAVPSLPLPAPAEVEPLSPAARGMLSTVTWQRNHAAAAYLEIDYDPRPWDAAAAAFRERHRSLVSPVLPLMAWQLARVAQELGVNGTVLEDGEARQVRYRQVNLGFTVQAGERLYLCVVEAAEAMTPAQFVGALFKLQQRAMGHKLTPAEMTGATVGFSSMARWGVQRHQPVLAPNTAVMIAHAAPAPGGERASLGVTYDHRLLSGFDAVRLLRKLAQPASYDD